MTLHVVITEPGAPMRTEFAVDAVVIDKHSIRLCRNGQEDTFVPPRSKVCVVPSHG